MKRNDDEKTDPDSLDSFLEEQAESGGYQGDGEFTLNQAEALKKLANFQLPFQGAWLIKVIQAAVAIGEKRPFVLKAANSVLCWDGQKFARKEQQVASQPTSLEVEHQWGGKSDNFFGLPLFGKIKKEITALTQVVTERCFACPVPLKLDGRRIDALLGNPTHGWNFSSFPYHASWHNVEALPSWKQSTESLRLPSEDKGTPSFEGFNTFARTRLEKVNPPEEASLIHILCAHFEWNPHSKIWSSTERSSVCYWLQDGVVIEQEAMFTVFTSVSSCLYLSAEGLRTDLSGFQLLESEERERRLQLAMRVLAPEVGESGIETFLQQVCEPQTPVGLMAAVGAFGVFCGVASGAGLVTVPATLLLAALASQSAKVGSLKSHSEALQTGLETLRRLYGTEAKSIVTSGSQIKTRL